MGGIGTRTFHSTPFPPSVLSERCVCVCVSPMSSYVHSKPNTKKQFCKRFPPGRPRIPHPHPPQPAPTSWPVCGPVSPPPLLFFRAVGLGAGPSCSALQEKGLLGDPQSGFGSGWCGVWGLGGGSRPTDENSKCSPAQAANRFQIGRVRARAAAAWLHKQPVAPDGGWLQPGEQVHGGLGGGVAAGGGPPPRLAGAERPQPAGLGCRSSESGTQGPEGAAKMEPIAQRRETEAQKGQGRYKVGGRQRKGLLRVGAGFAQSP